MKERIEYDSIGGLPIPAEVYYGVQTLRAKQNFDITGKRLHEDMIVSLAQVKKASAITNEEIGDLDPTIAKAIIDACNAIISGKFHDQFIVDPIQGGAGTSSNMNANEVVANIAIESLGGTKGDYSICHPNDHVNMAQSTNDVYPTSGKITALKLTQKLLFQMDRLTEVLTQKAVEFNDIIKVGRTQLQDAVPMRMGQGFKAYASAVARDAKRLRKTQSELYTVNLGGTAIGTAINANPEYLKRIAGNLKKTTGFDMVLADDLIDATQNLDAFVAVSGALKAVSVTLSKMANDFRLLSSGPKTGFAEINLPPKQNGSSIMPGKINPVIPEVVSQVAFNVIGNDLTITMAVEAGQLELNAFEPVMFYNLFESIETLTNAVDTFIDNCIIGITANPDRCEELLSQSIVTVTALCPYIGYKEASEIAKESILTGKHVEQIVKDKGLLNPEVLETLLDPTLMTEPMDESLEELIEEIV
ncbi:MAG: aspartate ammonia-lyase [Eubacterium sp.]|nr:aspartate ammonia-lyase [Eubacterium sp.]